MNEWMNEWMNNYNNYVFLNTISLILNFYIEKVVVRFKSMIWRPENPNHMGFYSFFEQSLKRLFKQFPHLRS